MFNSAQLCCHWKYRDSSDSRRMITFHTLDATPCAILPQLTQVLSFLPGYQVLAKCFFSTKISRTVLTQPRSRTCKVRWFSSIGSVLGVVCLQVVYTSYLCIPAACEAVTRDSFSAQQDRFANIQRGSAQDGYAVEPLCSTSPRACTMHTNSRTEPREHLACAGR